MIYWLASYPKSGNTWVRMFIQHYTTGNADINSDIMATRSDSWAPNYQAVSAISLDRLESGQFAALRGAQLQNVAAVSGKLKRILKTHNANKYVCGFPLIPEYLTNGAIYLIRDPRDVAVSYSAYLNKPIDEIIGLMGNEGAELRKNGVPQFVGSWSKHVKSWEGKGLFVHYERLLESPEREFARILKDYGYEVDRERVKASVKAVSLEEMQKQERRDGFREHLQDSDEPFFRNGGSHWEETLTGKQAAKIKRDHFEAMKRYGYV